jgi:hypothetical protein
VVQIQATPRQPLELRWSIAGILFRVLPSFFLITAILAYVFVGPNLPAIAVDVACVFVAVIFSKLIQGVVYRSYGIRSEVVLQDFGGGITPDAEPENRLQRIIVALADPASWFILLALVYYTNQEYEWSKQSPYLGFAYFILWIYSILAGAIGLLPIFPYPMGRVLLELLTLISPRGGLIATLVISILLGIGYIVYAVGVYFDKIPVLFVIPGVGTRTFGIIMAVFLGLATFRNFSYLQEALAQKRSGYSDERPWEQ